MWGSQGGEAHYASPHHTFARHAGGQTGPSVLSGAAGTDPWLCRCTHFVFAGFFAWVLLRHNRRGSLSSPRPASRAPPQTFSPGPLTIGVLTGLVCPSVLLCRLLMESSLCPRHLAQFLVDTPSMLNG